MGDAPDYRHVVLFRVFDEVSDERVDEAMRGLRSLATASGVVSWVVALSEDRRKGRVIVEDATFVDRDAFEAFRGLPEHARVAGEMSEISDWWVGDYVRSARRHR